MPLPAKTGKTPARFKPGAFCTILNERCVFIDTVGEKRDEKSRRFLIKDPEGEIEVAGRKYRLKVEPAEKKRKVATLKVVKTRTPVGNIGVSVENPPKNVEKRGDKR